MSNSLNKLPENIYVRKSKTPKHWSFPLKTTDIITSLDLGNINKKFNIYYDNKVPYSFGKKKSTNNSFDILGIKYYGHMPENSPNDEPPFFCMTVHVCNPAYKQKLLNVFNDITPILNDWIKKIHIAKTINSIKLDYWHHSSRIPPVIRLKQHPIEKEIFSLNMDLEANMTIYNNLQGG